MNHYNPNKMLNKEQWLESDEQQRIEIVEQYHLLNEDEGMEPEAKKMHSLIHVIVENQVAQNIETVGQTIDKLTRQGLKRHEAVHAIGAIISEDVFDLLQNGGKEFSMKKYRRKLEKITAKRWRKGQY